jgi:hypothetical protein
VAIAADQPGHPRKAEEQQNSVTAMGTGVAT